MNGFRRGSGVRPPVLDCERARIGVGASRAVARARACARGESFGAVGMASVGAVLVSGCLTAVLGLANAAAAPATPVQATGRAGARATSADPGAIGRVGAARPSTGELRAACGTANPYVALATHADPSTAGFADAPAVLALRDTPDNDLTAHVALATQAHVGAVFGLAYDAGREQLYAAAYHKVGVPFGPGGPGAIYRIDLQTGTVALWTTLDAGPDRHDPKRDDDAAAAPFVGHTSLGDIELSADGFELYAMSLFDGYVYRLSVPDGQVLGRFRHGAAGSAHAADLWPFGLGFRDGRLFHVVGVSSSDATSDGTAAIEVYRSDPDGTAMELFARFSSGVAALYDTVPMPIDVQPVDDASVLVAIRSRAYDYLLGAQPFVGGIPFGTLLIADHGLGLTGNDDSSQSIATYALPLGGIAQVPGTLVVAYPGIVADLGSGRAGDGAAAAAAAAAPDRAKPAAAPLQDVPEPPTGIWQLKMLWVEGTTGDEDAVEIVADAADYTRAFLRLAPGDVEALCPPNEDLDPGLVATGTAAAVVRGTATSAAIATAVAGTGTAVVPTLTAYATSAGATATAAAATATVTMGRSRPAPASYDKIVQSCSDGEPQYAVSILGGGYNLLGGSRFTEPKIVAFTRRSQTVVANGLGATYGLAYDWRRGHLYAAAYLKRYSPIGPAGLGTIYQIDLRTGQARPWAWSGTGPEPRAGAGIRNLDEEAMPWVGRIGYGDIEMSEDGSELYAVNMFDGRIHRFAVPVGIEIDAFHNGGMRERWAMGARVMGLGVRDGQVYHGVTNGLETGRLPLEVVVYRSDPDGANMTAVARLDLAYRRTPRWQPWRPYTNASGYYGGPQALVADIEWTQTGELIVGLRDRSADVALSGGAGDVLRGNDQNRFKTAPPFYGLSRFTPFAALAAAPDQDMVVTTVLDSSRYPYSGVAKWLDNTTGRMAFSNVIYRAQTSSGGVVEAKGPPEHVPSKVKGSMLADLVSLGDLELLCPPNVPTPTDLPTPTNTPEPTPTTTPEPTPTTTPTRTPTRTPTGTTTPTTVPGRLYLPVLHRQPCVPEERHADVALVLDLSTSMLRGTGGTRTKLEAALAAARLFADLVDLEADPEGRYDRVAVVGFNDTAWTEAEVTSDRLRVDRALDALPAKVAEGTRLDLAVDQGVAALTSRPRPGVTRVLILLTDGLPNRVPLGPSGTMEETVIARAEVARSERIRVFTVGLGLPDDVLRGLLQSVASDPADYYHAPTGEDLHGIYRRIAGRIVECP